MKLLLVIVVFILACAFVSEGRVTKVLGYTNATFPGRVETKIHSGYVAAKKHCEADFGDGAYVCTSRDVGIGAQIYDLANLNESTGVRIVDMSFATFTHNGQKSSLEDCRGFTSSDPTMYGRCFPRTLGGPVVSSACPCSQELHFLCCHSE